MGPGFASSNPKLSASNSPNDTQRIPCLSAFSFLLPYPMNREEEKEPSKSSELLGEVPKSDFGKVSVLSKSCRAYLVFPKGRI